jgi:flagellar basal body-associated protein FliL
MGGNLMKEPKPSKVASIMLLLMLVLGLMMGALLYFTSCTYSITQVHTEGAASDVVDETQSPSPNTSLNIPLK